MRKVVVVSLTPILWQQQMAVMKSLFDDERLDASDIHCLESSYQILTKGRSIFYEKGRASHCRSRIADLGMPRA